MSTITLDVRFKAPKTPAQIQEERDRNYETTKREKILSDFRKSTRSDLERLYHGGRDPAVANQRKLGWWRNSQAKTLRALRFARNVKDVPSLQEATKRFMRVNDTTVDVNLGIAAYHNEKARQHDVAAVYHKHGFPYGKSKPGHQETIAAHKLAAELHRGAINPGGATRQEAEVATKHAHMTERHFGFPPSVKAGTNDEESERGFVAHALTRKGTRLHSTAAHPTREAAVNAAFAAKPHAHFVSSSESYEGRDVGKNIQFHNKPHR